MELFPEQWQADIMVTIEDAVTFGDDEFGITFSVRTVAWGGAIGPLCTPYNYTPEVWVDARDDGAVEQRFSGFEHDDFYDDLAPLVKSFLEELKKEE